MLSEAKDPFQGVFKVRFIPKASPLVFFYVLDAPAQAFLALLKC